MRWYTSIGFIGLFIFGTQFSGVAKTSPREINIWQISFPRLTRLLQGKTREEALYQITSVSAQDKILQAADGTRYALVQYGRGEEARRLLFRAEEPQTFIACAFTPAHTRMLLENYQIHLDLSEKDFLTLFEHPSSFYTSANQTVYPVGNSSLFLLFESGQPVRFLTQQEAETFIKTQQRATPKPTPKPAASSAKKPTRWKALVNGGTTYEQIYLPRIVPPNNTPAKKSAQTNYDKI